MSRQIPASPNIEHLRNEAKLILKSQKNGDDSCCDILRGLNELRKKTNEEILNSRIILADVQFALAMDYGFKSWPELVHAAKGASTGIEQNAAVGDDQIQREMIDASLYKYLIDHESEFHAQVIEATNANGIKWNPGINGEMKWRGMEFMREGGKMLTEWHSSWPALVEPPAWDIMCRVRPGRNSWERVYVWCASEIGQIKGDFECDDHDVYDRMEKFFDDAKRAFKIPAAKDWLHDYYPFTKQLAVLGFLKNWGSCGRLLFVFCTTGSNDQSNLSSHDAWAEAIDRMNQSIGLSGSSTLERRLHRMYLDCE